MKIMLLWVIIGKNTPIVINYYNERKEIKMRTYIFIRVGISLKEVIHAHTLEEAYNKLYKRGIPFYAIKLEKEI